MSQLSQPRNYLNRELSELAYQYVEAGITEATVDGRSPEEQWRETLELFRSMQAEQYVCWQHEISPALKEAGICLAAFDQMDEPLRSRLLGHFDSNVLPMLTPLANDPAHPFPFISNLSVSISAYWFNPD